MYKLDGLKETTGQKAVHAKQAAQCLPGEPSSATPFLAFLLGVVFLLLLMPPCC